MIENSSNDNSVIEESEYQSQRTIEEVIDVETGEIVSAEDFFSQDEAIIIRARAILEISIQSDVPKYKCLFCEQSVKISGRRIFERNKIVYFFAHFKDSNDCPIKTGVKLGLEELLAKKYHGLRESELHLTLKIFIADSLRAETATQKGFHNVLVEATFKNIDISNTWRRPDVKAAFVDKNIVFELQLSTTFLSVVVGRDAFYRQHETYIIWAFGGLNTVAEWQKLMEKDIYYAHKRNVFLIDEEAKTASIEQGELVLHCYWQIPKIVDEKVQIEWHKKLVTLDQLTYDEATYEAYYYNSDKDFYEIADAKEKTIIDAWDKAKEERWDKIKFRIKSRELSQEDLEKQQKRTEQRDKVILEKIANKEIVPTRFNQNGKWGYKYEKHIIVEAQYAGAKAYKYGVAEVKDDDGCKYIIDLSGNVIINLGRIKILGITIWGQYLKIKVEEEIEFGYNRMRSVKVVLDKLFDFKGSLIFDEIGDFIDGKAKVKQGWKWGHIDEVGTYQIDSTITVGINLNKIQKMCLWGLSTSDGKELTDCKYTEMEDFIEGRAKVQKNGNWGYINEVGEEFIPCEYTEIEDFIDGKAKVKQGWKWGHIDEAGTIQIDSTIAIGINLNKIQKMCLWGLSTPDIKELTACEYTEMENFIEGRAKVQKNWNWGYINEVGEEFIACEYTEMEDFIEGRAKVQKNWEWGYINELGETLIPFEYDAIRNFIEGKAIARRDNKVGYIDENGEILIPFEYDEIKDFVLERAIVQKNSKWGCINSEGEILISFEYDYIGNFIKGKAIAQKDDKWVYINEIGEILIQFEYDYIENFIKGKAIVRKDNTWGCINELGEVLIPCIFSKRIVEKISKIKNINGVEIYENEIGEVIIPSLEYLSNPDTLSVFKTIPVKAKVEGIADFGVFLTFCNEITNKGLLHNSEIEKVNLGKTDSQFSIKSNVDVRIPDGNSPIKGKISLEERTYNQFVIGSIIEVYIKNIDIPTGKISFTLRKPVENYKALKSQDESVYKELKTLEGSIVEGKVTNIKNFGVFIEICEGVTGLLHISDLKQYGINEKKIEKYFAKGDILSVSIISVNLKLKRVELGYVG